MSRLSRLIGKGNSPEKAEWLDRMRIPSFMKIASHYEVVINPRIVGSAPFGLDDIYLYGVRDIYNGGPVMFFECPFPNLPSKFWVRKVVAAYEYYHFISADDESAMEPKYPTPLRSTRYPVPNDIVVAH